MEKELYEPVFINLGYVDITKIQEEDECEEIAYHEWKRKENKQ